MGNPFTGSYDSASIYEYVAGTNFSLFSDSATFMAYRSDSSADTAQYHWKDHGLRAGYDYRIYIHASGKTYTVTGITAIGRETLPALNHDIVVCYNTPSRAAVNGNTVTADSVSYDDYARVVYLK